MNALRTNFAFRAATVTVVFFAWLVFSNHCALAEMLAVKTAPVSAGEHSCCDHQPAPAKDGMPHWPMQKECCKSLTVLVVDGVKLPVIAQMKVGAPPAAVQSVPVIPLRAEQCSAPATGPPPDIPSLIELVLHRSLRSHAPPFAA